MEKIYNYFEKTTKKYLELKDKKYRKDLSQFFTAQKTAKLMVDKLEINFEKKELKILEPSAGMGILIVALVEKILRSYKKIKKLDIEVIEIDENIANILLENLEFLKKNISDKLEFNFFVKNKNFIDEYGKTWIEGIADRNKYDIIISNPPYKKIKKDDYKNSFFPELIDGQPNIYHLFIALSLKMLAKGGSYILISPKNYLGGRYTKNLRTFIFNNFYLKDIYLFDKRNKVFGSEVLQEICISYYMNEIKDKVRVHYNKEKFFEVELRELLLANSNALILPKSEEDLKTKNRIVNEFILLKEQNLEFKIGKVVQFRIEDKYKFKQLGKNIPLLLPHHIKRNEIKFQEINNKNIAISLNEETQKKVIENKNYVILRKNVDFESKYFIQATVYDKTMFNSKFIAIDNNLAYIQKKSGELSLKEANSICDFLNSELFEKYYKMVNSSHTINSYEMSNMLFPKFIK